METRLDFTFDSAYITVTVMHTEFAPHMSIFNAAANHVTESSFDGYHVFEEKKISLTETHFYFALKS